MIRNNDVWAMLSEYKCAKLIVSESRKSLHETFDDVRNRLNRVYHLETISAQVDL